MDGEGQTDSEQDREDKNYVSFPLTEITANIVPPTLFQWHIFKPFCYKNDAQLLQNIKGKNLIMPPFREPVLPL